MKRFVFFSMLLMMLSTYAEAIKMNGSKKSIVGGTGNYTLVASSDELGKNFIITCNDNGIMAGGGRSKTLTAQNSLNVGTEITWTKAGTGIVTVKEENNEQNTYKIEVVIDESFTLDEGYSGEPLVLNVSKSNLKQFDAFNVTLAEHYKETPTKVEWNIAGAISQNDLMSTTSYIPTTGTKTISAKVYFKETSQTKTVSTTVTVGAGTPDLAGYRILGPTNYGIGTATYFTSDPYTTTDVVYNWTSSFKTYVQTSTSERLAADFPTEGSYLITCQAKDKRTGKMGTTVSLRVSVTKDGAITRADDALFDIALDAGRMLRIEPIEEEALQGMDKAQYSICNLTTGTVEQAGPVDKVLGANVDVSSLRKGLYVLYIQVDGKSLQPYKFSLNK